MMATQGKDKTTEVVVSDKALQLAKGWVTEMGSVLDMDEHDAQQTKVEMRPLRLGLGAKYLPHSVVTGTMSSVEKNLRAKINSSHKSKEPPFLAFTKKGNPTSETTPTQHDNGEEEEDSRASSFVKRQRITISKTEHQSQKRKRSNCKP